MVHLAGRFYAVQLFCYDSLVDLKYGMVSLAKLISQ